MKSQNSLDNPIARRKQREENRVELRTVERNK